MFTTTTFRAIHNSAAYGILKAQGFVLDELRDARLVMVHPDGACAIAYRRFGDADVLVTVIA